MIFFVKVNFIKYLLLNIKISNKNDFYMNRCLGCLQVGSLTKSNAKNEFS